MHCNAFVCFYCLSRVKDCADGAPTEVIFPSLFKAAQLLLLISTLLHATLHTRTTSPQSTMGVFGLFIFLSFPKFSHLFFFCNSHVIFINYSSKVTQFCSFNLLEVIHFCSHPQNIMSGHTAVCIPSGSHNQVGLTLP